MKRIMFCALVLFALLISPLVALVAITERPHAQEVHR
jgi:hypothetical protein